MPKPQYMQKFRDSWLQDPQLTDWLQVIESIAGQVPKCKICGTILRCHYEDLKSHGISKKHFSLKGKYCNKYEILINVIKQIGTKESYQPEIDDDSAERNDSSEENDLI